MWRAALKNDLRCDWDSRTAAWKLGMDLGNCRWHRYLGIGDGDGKGVGWSGGVRKAWKDLVPTSGMARIAAPLGRLITRAHFSECPGEALLSPFLKTRGSQSPEMLNSVAWGHISFCDTARNRMCFLSPAPASWTCYRCSFQQRWEGIQEQRRRREEKSDGKVSWEEAGSKIYLTDHAGFFPCFWRLCLYTCCCKGSVPQLEHRWMFFFQGQLQSRHCYAVPAWRAGQATDLGWFHVNLCRADLVISTLYHQACRRHLGTPSFLSVWKSYWSWKSFNPVIQACLLSFQNTQSEEGE